MEKRKAGKAGGLSVFFWVLGGLCVLYWVLSTWMKPNASWKLAFWIWPAAGAFFLLTGFVREARRRGRVRIPKGLRIAFYSLLILCVCVFLFFEAVLVSHLWDVPAREPQVLLVLGSGVQGTSPSKSLVRRIETAASYLLEHPDVTVLACGGQGEDEEISEAECIRRELIARGIDEERIAKEESSTSTDENLRNARQMLEEGTSVCVVTSNFHVMRARAYAFAAGFTDVSSLSAPFPELTFVHYLVREFAAFVRDYMYGVVRIADVFR